MQRDSSYKELVKCFKEKKLMNRFLFLLRTAKVFLKDYALEDKVYIDEALLEEVMLDYFSDIKRLKDFHGIERSNPKKIAAYLGYWLYKRKPLHINSACTYNDIKTTDQLKHVNEYFSAFVMIYIIYDRSAYIQLTSDETRTYREFIHNLLYFLCYRVVTPQALELTLQALETTADQLKRKKPIT